MCFFRRLFKPYKPFLVMGFCFEFLIKYLVALLVANLAIMTITKR